MAKFNHRDNANAWHEELNVLNVHELRQINVLLFVYKQRR